MVMIPWIILTILVLVIILAIVAIFVNKGKKTPPDYYNFFIIGITWIPLGMATKNHAFTIMGLVFMAVGLTNKDKWKQNHKTWSQLDKKEQKVKLIIIAVLGVLFLAGIVVYFLYNKGII